MSSGVVCDRPSLCPLRLSSLSHVLPLAKMHCLARSSRQPPSPLFSFRSPFTFPITPLLLPCLAWSHSQPKRPARGSPARRGGDRFIPSRQHAESSWVLRQPPSSRGKKEGKRRRVEHRSLECLNHTHALFAQMPQKGTPKRCSYFFQQNITASKFTHHPTPSTSHICRRCGPGHVRPPAPK